jgi:capsular polysaccharide biosynthesis protein
MPDLFDILFRWKKQMLLLIFITAIATTIIVFLIPKKYLGVATALPSPSYAADKTGVFSQNLQGLYSALGSPDDLDIILGTARLDTVYKAVTKQFDLAEHYHIKEDTVSLQKAAYFLKNRTRVIKTGYGELQVKVWDTDKKIAANLANAVMEKLQQIHQDVQTTNNATMLSKINGEYAEKKMEYQKILDSLQHTNDAATTDFLNIQKASLLQQMQEYGRLSDQYKLMVDAKPQALIIIERATPPLKADNPKRLLVIVAAMVLSFFFALLIVLVLERKRMMAK